MTKIKKKDLNDIDKQLRELAFKCKSSEIPRSKTRWKRNGCNLPLSGWMKGVKDGEKSKIDAVSNARASFAYSQFWYASEEMAYRISKKKQITDVQYALLLEHILQRYRGHMPKHFCMPDWVLNTKSNAHGKFFYRLMQLCENAVPLNLILSEELTDLVLLTTLFDSAMEARK